MKRNLAVALDAVLALWITLIVAQHLAVVAGALWGSPAGDARLDLRPGYWLLSAPLIIGAAASRLMRTPEVSVDR